jgi:hypothetical protein
MKYKEVSSRPKESLTLLIEMYVRAMMTFLYIYRVLRLTYEDEEIPEWVKRPEKPSTTVDKETSPRTIENQEIQGKPIETQESKEYQPPISRKTLTIEDSARVFDDANLHWSDSSGRGEIIPLEDT